MFLAMLMSICWGFSHVFPKAWNLVVDADSLAIIEFARDIVLGKSIAAWNLPRAPYLFPDALIAILVMSFGWLNSLSFLIIATINFCLLIAIFCLIINRIRLGFTVPIWAIGLLITFSLLVIGCLFPFSMDNLFWQIFASGAHFLTAIVVMLIMVLARPQDGQILIRPNLLHLFVVGFLVFAETLSDSMSALLLLIWYATTIFSSNRRGFKRWTQYLYIPTAVFLGTILSFFIPRQALVGSFFAFNKFITGVELFFLWVGSSLANDLFIGVLVIASICFPFLISDRFPRTLKEFCCGLFSNFTLPALGIIAVTPLFYQGVGSLRYLAFPGLLLLLSLTLIILKGVHKILSLRLGRQLIVIFGAVLTGGMLLLAAYAKKADDLTVKEITLSSVAGAIPASQNADLAVQCIEQAATQYSLGDGIATYWHARPIYFASKFKYYLAPVSPWQPRGGYMYWGNNGLDLVYESDANKKLRKYNYILTTNDELAISLWGSLEAQSFAKIRCQNHTVLVFEDSAILDNFLFPFGKPFNIDAHNKVVRPNNNAFQWAVRPYWGPDLFTLVGKGDGMNIRTKGQQGVLVYGPFVALPPGSYRLLAKGHLEGPEEFIGTLEAISNQGQVIYSSASIVNTTINSSQIGELFFKLNQSVADVEFRLLVNQNTSGVFSRYELVKLAD